PTCHCMNWASAPDRLIWPTLRPKGLHVHPPRRLRVIEIDRDDLLVRYDMIMSPGDRLSVGRGGDLRIATHPVDKKVSRLAVEIRVRDDGWAVTAHNRNGVLLHRWAQPVVPLRRHVVEHVRWRWVGVRPAGRTDRQYWILLDDESAEPSIEEPQHGA